MATETWTHMRSLTHPSQGGGVPNGTKITQVHLLNSPPAPLPDPPRSGRGAPNIDTARVFPGSQGLTDPLTLTHLNGLQALCLIKSPLHVSAPACHVFIIKPVTKKATSLPFSRFVKDSLILAPN